MLEPVPGTTANQPDILHRGMPVDDEVTVGSLFILTHARLNQRRVLQGREAEADAGTGVGRPRQRELRGGTGSGSGQLFTMPGGAKEEAAEAEEVGWVARCSRPED